MSENKGFYPVPFKAAEQEWWTAYDQLQMTNR